jgi:DNA invertase Pin-like site-specific DNA recombinase
MDTPKQVGLYLRVSTANGQTVENQRVALTEAMTRRGWTITEESPTTESAVPGGATSGRHSTVW